MSLRLHEPSHDPKHGVERPVQFGDHRRDDGVVGALVRGEGVGVALGEGEAAAAILKAEVVAFGYYAGAEATIV